MNEQNTITVTTAVFLEFKYEYVTTKTVKLDVS